jgi:hypothetical protein
MYEPTQSTTQHSHDDHGPQQTLVGAAVTAAVPPGVVLALSAPAVAVVILTTVVAVAGVARAVHRRPADTPDETDPPTRDHRQAATRDHGAPADD